MLQLIKGLVYHGLLNHQLPTLEMARGTASKAKKPLVATISGMETTME